MLLLLLSFTFPFLVLLCFRLGKPGGRARRDEIPSPAKLPIIGNLHQLGSLPHRSLCALSRKHGPIMLMHMGTSPILVVSSEGSAREMIKDHDLVFSDRATSVASDELLYHGKDVAFAPYGEYWRQVKKLSVVHLLSTRRVESFRLVREEEIACMIEKISQSCDSPFNLSDLIIATTNNIVCKSALGKKYYEEKISRGHGFHELLAEFLILLGKVCVGDVFPSLAWIDNLTGVDARLKNNFKELDGFLDKVIDDHEEQRKIKKVKEDSRPDLVDILLEAQKDDSTSIPLHKDNIKAILLDNFAAGTDTTFTVVEWTLAELIRHPLEMKKLQEEIRKIAEGKSTVSEDDLQQMLYLRCVIKESLRLHPPLPLLVPRRTTQDVKLQGFNIPRKTKVMVNAWAIGRDPNSWENPDDFQPERFVDSGIDFKGQDFKLIPFGAGRRACPGIPFAMASVELVLANVLHSFDWEQLEGDTDMSEVYGITTHRKTPLILVPRLHFS